jgi:hypothetical protein
LVRDSGLYLRGAGSEINVVLSPGSHAELELGGSAPARPGEYSTAARITTDDGAVLHIPVTVEIPAATRWGVGFLLAGLFFLGLINVLNGESEVKARLHDALAARQDVQSWLEFNPPPQSRLSDVESMNREFDAAIAGLSERRRVSFIDHRAAGAEEHLKAAETASAVLRHDLSAGVAGTAEIADLAREWSELQTTLQRVGASPPDAVISSSNQPSNLASKLDSFLARYRTRFLQQPVGWMSDEMTTDLDRIRLATAAGEIETARALAVKTRRWLRRSARSLDSALVGYRGALVQAGTMVVSDSAVRARIARGDFPVTDKAPIIAMLDAASAKMDGEAWLPEWAEANHQINSAKTALVRATTEAMKAQFSQAIAVVNASTDTSDVEHLISDLQAAPDHSPAAKQAGLSRVLDLWKAHIASVSEPAIRAKLQNSVDLIAADLARGDVKATAAPYRVLGDDWVSWNTHLLNQARDRLDHQNCLDAFADLQRDIAAVEAGLIERPQGADRASWDMRLDQIRLDMQRQGPDAETITADCMAPLLALTQRANDLSGEILTANIIDLEVPALTRARLARASGLPAAIAATQYNIDRARTLDIDIATPQDERVVGRPLVFSVGHPDPVWGSGVQIGVIFGDGSPAFVATAEQLRQGAVISHTYKAPLTAKLAVVAATDLTRGGTEPVGSLLGEGGTTILIAPSPVTRAQILADGFFNARFGLALLIALIVYYWRYQNKTAIFGARSYDYVEAFALGFAANAAVVKLPEILARLTPL